MKSGGAIGSKAGQVAIRYGGLISSLALATLIAFVGADWLTFSNHTISPIAAFGLALLWLIFGSAQYYVFSLRSSAVVIRSIGYHLLGIITIIFATGAASAAIISYWILLSLANFAYFQKKGLIISLLSLWTVVASDILLHHPSTETLTGSLGGAFAVSIITIAVVIITSGNGKSEHEVALSKQEARLQQESLETLINNITDAVLSTDKNGKVRIYNAAAVGLLDTNQSLSGRAIDDIIVLHDENDRRIKLTELLSSASSLVINDNLRTVIADEDVRLEITYSPIRSAYTNNLRAQNTNGYIIILRDITKAKSLEEERDEFISVVSHELRTPITIAEGAIDNAQVIFKKDPNKKELVAKSLTVAHDQTIFLSRMINDLSTLSRAERGVADAPELIDVKELVMSLKDEYAPQAKKKALSFDLEISGNLGFVKVSHLYLHELLQNFITNAIKYTKEGTVTLKVTGHADMVELSVVDTGIGISKSDQQKVFKKFYRSEDYRTRETGGTGLGLYVAEKLAKKLRVSISLTSRLNHGSTFSFTLPKEKKK